MITLGDNKLSNKKVAVIMSVYISDQLPNIKLAVNSILQQEYINIVLYIYLDGPVDNDVEQYMRFIDERFSSILLIKNKFNKGLACALNALIDEVMSNENICYIARMDSDDISRPERISRQVKFLEENQVDVVGGYCREFGSTFSLNKKMVPLEHHEIVKFSITRCPLIHPTVMFRREVFISKSVRYPESTKFTEDMALWFLMLSKGFKFANIPQVLLDYRLSEDTVKRRKGLDKCISEVKLRTKYMFLLKEVSLYNIVIISSRFVFHLMPSDAMKYLYLKLR